MRTRTAAEVAAQSAGDGGESASQRPGARAIPSFKRATSWISDLLRDFQGAKRRGARASLLLVGDGEAKQQPAAELVVVHLVGLDGLAVEPRRGGVPLGFAGVDEGSLSTLASTSRVNWPAATRSTVDVRPADLRGNGRAREPDRGRELRHLTRHRSERRRSA